LDLITSVANQLLQATAATAALVSEQVLARVVEQLDLDLGFLRHHDDETRTSLLIAQWPPRPDVAAPHRVTRVPLGRDPAWALGDRARRPTVITPDQMAGSWHRWIAGRCQPGPSSAVLAPLVSGEVITGMLGAVRCGDTDWEPETISVLEALACLFTQLQARLVAEDKLRYLAEHDDLTGLLNRRALLAHLSDRLAPGEPGPVAVVYADLDRLKAVNDCLGHAAGDWFIHVFAERLRDCAGGADVVGRLGGDEFVIIPNQAMATAAAESFADELRTAVRERLVVGGHTVTRSVSIGVAVGVPGRDNGTDLLHRADEAVVAAKRAGGNQVVVADDVTLKSLENFLRNDIELQLQGAIDPETLVLHYLPEVDLRTGAIVAAEALVRWRHRTRGLLLPDAFLGVAETMNLGGDLGRWVLRNACAEFSRWRAGGVGDDAVLRVNVSPPQLADRRFARTVADIISEFGIGADSLCLEITPHAVVHDIESTQRTLMDLKEIGVQIAIDDFGTGYAVLSRIRSLPIDTLKIDKVFVRQLGTNANDLAIVRAIIGLAEVFDLQIVAEGVETPAAAWTLMQHGCRRAQGFLFSPPIPGDAMHSLLAAGRLPRPLFTDDALAGSAV
jgi:diguanylate cyclase (GGDEF)-like protein